MGLLEFGQRLRAVRVSRGLTQITLASQVGVGNTYISDLERGHKGTPTGDMIARLAETLGTSADYLLGLDDHSNTNSTSFATSESKIHVVLPSTDVLDPSANPLNWYHPYHYLQGIAEGAQELGISTNIISEPTKETELAVGREGSPLVFLAPPPAEIASQVSPGYSCIFINPPTPYGGHNIMIDQSQGTYQAIQALIASGRRRIAFLRCPLKHTEYQLGRIRGFRRALAENDVPYYPEMALETSGSIESGYLAMQRLLQLAKLPDAVFAATDLRALGAMQALQEAGLRIPGDVAVVGFDDIPEAATANPPLSTVRFPRIEAGRTAIHLAAMLLRRKEVPHITTLETTYVPRQSVGTA